MLFITIRLFFLNVKITDGSFVLNCFSDAFFI
jgi:hypothetical protein